ncbi:hypothetical protein [Acidaminobacter sp.]|uniref:hypothetical protein n=1 Tax=Acidaminobacter sp. TaxID=1872102 RepID=UPI0025693DDE|nr:hypothetical protein [Acidaminobacter sp.]MDK9710905.1 hypothetical protein [Acidaminobacter sp.]
MIQSPDHLKPVLIVDIGKPDEAVRLTELPDSGDVSCSRNEQHVTYVPKRPMDELLINK